MKPLWTFLLAGGVLAFGQTDPVVAELASAEKSFSAASEKYGINASFLQFLSDDCVMFNPYPVNGKEIYRKRPETSTFLSWFPTFVQVSASGDFGISSGPWIMRKSRMDTASTLTGHYFSVWSRQNDGQWKVILDEGIRYPLDLKRKEQEQFSRLSVSEKKRVDQEKTRISILKTEKEFAELLQTSGAKAAYDRFASEHMRTYREGNFPGGQKRGSELLRVNDSITTFLPPLAVKYSSSGDMGYTYGFSLNSKNDTSNYVRVWRNEGEWKIAVDILESLK